MKGAMEIYKRDFYGAGGFSNPNQYRKMISGTWHYYRIITH
jgi:hypothetical protein